MLVSICRAGNREGELPIRFLPAAESVERGNPIEAQLGIDPEVPTATTGQSVLMYVDFTFVPARSKENLPIGSVPRVPPCIAIPFMVFEDVDTRASTFFSLVYDGGTFQFLSGIQPIVPSITIPAGTDIKDYVLGAVAFAKPGLILWHSGLVRYEGDDLIVLNYHQAQLTVTAAP
jgi:hypothetical protein